MELFTISGLERSEQRLLSTALSYIRTRRSAPAPATAAVEFVRNILIHIAAYPDDYLTPSDVERYLNLFRSRSSSDPCTDSSALPRLAVYTVDENHHSLLQTALALLENSGRPNCAFETFISEILTEVHMDGSPLDPDRVFYNVQAFVKRFTEDLELVKKFNRQYRKHVQEDGNAA